MHMENIAMCTIVFLKIVAKWMVRLYDVSRTLQHTQQLSNIHWEKENEKKRLKLGRN